MTKTKVAALSALAAVLAAAAVASTAEAQTIPEWVKQNALWYGQGLISEAEFLNAITFLIGEGIIIVDAGTGAGPAEETVIIPNGNSELSAGGFYIPLNLEARPGTAVTWVNDDSVPHNIQSIDLDGNIIQSFNSPQMNTGDRFSFTFEEEGVFKYFCSFHPWRIGIVTVS